MDKRFQYILGEVTRRFIGVYVDFEVIEGDKVKVEITQYEDDFYNEEDTKLLIKIITKRLDWYGYPARNIKYNYDFLTNETVAAKITFIVDV